MVLARSLRLRRRRVIVHNDSRFVTPQTNATNWKLHTAARLALSVYAFVAGLYAIVRNDDRLSETARRAGIAIFLAVTAASAVLVYSAFTNDFSVAYIRATLEPRSARPVQFAALWSGQEGSLLFWCWLLAAYGLVLRMRHKVDTRLVAHASVVISAVQIFFLILVNFAAHPFAMTTGTIRRTATD